LSSLDPDRIDEVEIYEEELEQKWQLVRDAKRAMVECAQSILLVGGRDVERAANKLLTDIDKIGDPSRNLWEFLLAARKDLGTRTR
jgi:hypothetical protein